MKHRNFFTLLVFCLVFGLFSCEKQDSVMPPEQAIQNAEAKLPHFNDLNSEKYDFDDLPEDLKNATVLTGKNTIKQSSARRDMLFLFRGGPFGGSGGTPFHIEPPSSDCRIDAIAIRSGELIDGLIVWYVNESGRKFQYSTGGSGGTYYLHRFDSNEKLRYVEGRTGWYVDFIKFQTNKKTFEHGGSRGDTGFYTNAGWSCNSSCNIENEILGFFGKSGALIDQIGFIVYTPRQ